MGLKDRALIGSESGREQLMVAKLQTLVEKQEVTNQLLQRLVNLLSTR